MSLDRESLRAKGYIEVQPGVWCKAGSARICSGDKKPVERVALECPISRENQGRARAKIVFRIYARRPADWDGYDIKELQDMLIKAGILADDRWDLLQGEVISEKIHTKAEERTEIEILYA